MQKSLFFQCIFRVGSRTGIIFLFCILSNMNATRETRPPPKEKSRERNFHPSNMCDLRSMSVSHLVLALCSLLKRCKNPCSAGYLLSQLDVCHIALCDNVDSRLGRKINS